MKTTLSDQRGKRRVLIAKLLLLAAMLASGFVLVRFTPVGEFFEEKRLIALFESLSHEWWTPLLLIGLFCLVAPLGLPASPILLGGAMVFGFVKGSIFNIVGLMAGAMVSFFVGRSLGREAIVQLAGQRLRRAEKIFERRGFWPLIQIRFLPIPFSVVSYAAALAGVSTGRYFITSLLGLTPATLVHTYFAPPVILATLHGERPVRLFILYAGALIGLNVIAGWPQLREALRRRRRLTELRARRSARRLAPTPLDPARR